MTISFAHLGALTRSAAGRAIAGVIGLPFHNGAPDIFVAPSEPASTAAGVVLHGVVGLGVFGLPRQATGIHPLHAALIVR